MKKLLIVVCICFCSSFAFAEDTNCNRILGDLYYGTYSDYGKSLDYYQQCLNEDPDNPDCLNGVAISLFGIREEADDEIYGYIIEAIKNDPTCRIGWKNLTKMFLYEYDEDLAREIWDDIK